MPTPEALAQFRAFLSTLEPDKPTLVIASFLRTPGLDHAQSKVHCHNQQKPLLEVMAPFNGQIISGRDRPALTLEGPPPMYEQILQTPDLLATLNTIREYHGLRINI